LVLSSQESIPDTVDKTAGNKQSIARVLITTHARKKYFFSVHLHIVQLYPSTSILLLSYSLINNVSFSGVNLETNLLTAVGALLLLAAFLGLGASLFNIWEVRNSWGHRSSIFGR
jgi:hypothetical protein